MPEPDVTMERQPAPYPLWDVFSGGTCIGTVRRASRGLYIAESSIDDVVASAPTRVDAADQLHLAYVNQR